MTNRLFTLAAVILTLASCGPRLPHTGLKFHEDGTFKILQLTDTHLCSDEYEDTTHFVMRSVIAKEKPDLIVLTGDVCWREPFDPWYKVRALLDSCKTPYAVVFGNHDIDSGSLERIIDYLCESPYFVGSRGPEDVYGCGNYALTIEGHESGKTEEVLYMIDSHTFVKLGRQYGKYDVIRQNQVRWYDELSAAFTKSNGGTPIPSLAFWHIAPLEVKNVWGGQFTIGARGESEGCAILNSGIFEAFVENQDVKGIFFGHDHENDYGGTFCDIGLFYGRCTGTSNYEMVGHGGRVIVLHEGGNRYDTYVTTPDTTELYYYYPSRVTGLDEKKAEYLPALQGVNPTENGVAYTYYEFPDNHFLLFGNEAAATKTLSGTMPNFDITQAPAPDMNNFLYHFHSLIKIPKTAVYRFALTSDDKSQLWIDGKLVVNNPNGRSYYWTDKVALQEGFHDLKIAYAEYLFNEYLYLNISSKDTDDVLVPNEMLYLPVE